MTNILRLLDKLNQFGVVRFTVPGLRNVTVTMIYATPYCLQCTFLDMLSTRKNIIL